MRAHTPLRIADSLRRATSVDFFRRGLLAQAGELLLFFATVQVPIFILPALLRPLYRRLAASDTPGA